MIGTFNLVLGEKDISFLKQELHIKGSVEYIAERHFHEVTFFVDEITRDDGFMKKFIEVMIDGKEVIVRPGELILNYQLPIIRRLTDFFQDCLSNVKNKKNNPYYTFEKKQLELTTFCVRETIIEKTI
jgi:hypothetical protein